ncbi:MAG: lipocalin family protein [Chitinophagaceae bacterium]
MKKLLVIAFAITALGSCKKSDDTQAQLEVTAANIAGVYKITAVVEVEGGVTYDRFNGGTLAGGLSYPSDYEACEKDDTFTFTAAGNVTNAEGAVSCTPATPSITAPYTVNTTAKTLTSFGITSTVKSLTSSTMVLENTSSSGGVTTVTTTTFSK